MIARHRAGRIVAVVGLVGLAALLGCSTLLGVDKDYVEISVFGPSDGGDVRDSASDGPLSADSSVTPPTDGGPLPPPVALAAGGGSTCAVLSGGSVACWGDNAEGSLGDGTTDPRLRPVTTRPLGDRALTVAVGGDVVLGAHACALLATGAKCWGARNGPDAGPNLEPTDVPGWPADLVDGGGQPMIAAGGNFTCASVGGPVYCWGANESGQLGDGTRDSRDTPAPVLGITTTRALGAGNRHACAITSDGMLCWGANTTGQLGIYGAGPNTFPTPGKVYGGGDAVALGLGADHSCMVRATGKMSCWGANGAGQLGNGNNQTRGLPDQVNKNVGSEFTGKAIFAGGNHTCAILSDAGVDCWGANASGQLGDGTAQDSNLPVPVHGVTTLPSGLALGTEHTCALFPDQTASCWGAGGRLGSGTSSPSTDPVRVAF